MRKEVISQIENTSCYVSHQGVLFLGSDQDFKHFKNLNEALKRVKENIISLLLEKENFFKTLSIPKENNVLKKIRNLRNSFQQEIDPHYFLDDKKENFFEVLRRIEDVKVFSRSEHDPAFLKIIKIRDQLLNQFVQAEKLIEIKNKNESVSRKISKELTNCREGLRFLSPQEEIDQLLTSRLKDRLFYCKLHLKDAIFISPYRERFKELEEFLFNLKFKGVADFKSFKLQEKIIELCEIFEYKILLR